MIMPVNTEELEALMDKSDKYDEIITQVHSLFEVDKIKFDIEWRDKFMSQLV